MLSSIQTLIKGVNLMDRMESLRLARGWSKAELARRAGLSEADVGKIESGRLRPYPGQLRKLAKALHVSLSRISERPTDIGARSSLRSRRSAATRRSKT